MITCCKDGVEYLSSPGIQTPHGFSTRVGGVSEGIFESLNLGHRRGGGWL